MSWVVSSLLAGTLAFMVFKSMQKLILNSDNPVESSIKFGPIYLFMVGFLIAMVTIKKGLKHVGLDLSTGEAFLYSTLLGVAVAFLGSYLIRKVKTDPKADKKFHYTNVERIFAVLMIFTASAMAFAHGSNDVANAVGPMAAVISTAQSGLIASKSALPGWVLLVGGIGIVIGLATFGVGKKITQLTPSRGFAAELAAATTIVIASGTGIPISTTHTLVGAVLGVGMARGI